MTLPFFLRQPFFSGFRSNKYYSFIYHIILRNVKNYRLIIINLHALPFKLKTGESGKGLFYPWQKSEHAKYNETFLKLKLILIVMKMVIMIIITVVMNILSEYVIKTPKNG